MLNLEIGALSHDVHCYMEASGYHVSSIVLYIIAPKSDGDVWFGAYYGAVGGGENDGGYFLIDVEKGTSDHFDYNELDGFSEDEPQKVHTLEAVMRALWTLVNDDEGELSLSEEGSKYFIPNEDEIWTDSQFDGDTLAEVSEQWKLRVKFES